LKQGRREASRAVFVSPCSFGLGPASWQPVHGTEQQLARFMNMNSKSSSACMIAVAALAAALPVQAQDRNPIVYNHQGNEVGVIQSIKPNGDAVMLPTQATLDLGYYDVVMPATMLRPRARGGWETSMTNEDIAFLPPVPHRFFMPSGD
jgi:5-formyltetrahydrofolate cyclo-ligase